MTATDVLISSLGSTQQWERYITPNTTQDKLVTMLDGSTEYLNYADGSDVGGGPAVLFPDALTRTSFATDAIKTFSVAACYYDPVDTTLPGGAFSPAYRFDYQSGFVSATTPTDPVELAVDLWAGGRPAVKGDSVCIALRNTALGVEVVDRNNIRSFMTDAEQSVHSDALAIILGYTSTWAVRFSIAPRLVLAIHETGFDADAEAAAEIFTVERFGSFDPRFVITYSLPIQRTTPPIQPRFHDAKRVMAAAQQPPIILGTNPR